MGAIPLQGNGLVRVVSPAALNAYERTRDAERAAAEDRSKQPDYSGLAGYIRTKFEQFKLHRNNPQSGWTERLLAALRTFNGSYSPDVLALLKQFGGSEVYVKIVAAKCRGATALLRDVYLGPDRPWGIDPPVDPPIPQNILDAISALVQHEVQAMVEAGQPPDMNGIRDRTMKLVESARQAAKRKAAKQADIAEDKIQEMLVEGKYYEALAEFLVDLPTFPFACLKGPVVRIVPSVDWSQGGRPVVTQKPRLFWQRVSPFDIWWTPGVDNIEVADVIERSRLTRGELNDLLDLPGYNQTEVRAVLQEYGAGGLNDNWDMSDAERAVQESRENPWVNRSGLISCLEFHGNVQGQMLLDQGVSSDMVDDPVRDYTVQAWLIGTHVIKVQMSPSPRKRHPYYVTSFEKVPGTIVGNGLPDMLSDIQDVANATMRALVNNMSMASGPQVVVNDDRLAADEDGEAMYPWKRWHTIADPLSNNTQVPVSFFQPASNANELLLVYKELNNMADDLSALPRYLSGQAPGGAGRTSSGLAMLMGNTSKVMQTVASNCDRDVVSQSLSGLFDMIMLTDDSGLLTGEESIRVKGVQVAVQRETQRARQLEFLQVSANPIDMQIMGVKGRANVLRSVSKTIGLDDTEVVPSEDEIEQQQKAQQAVAAEQQKVATAAQGAQQGPTVTGDVGPRENLHKQQPRVAGGPH